MAMEDIIEELINCAQSVVVPIEPATEEQLLEVQEQIYISLPKDYRDFLLNVGHLVVGTLEPATVSDPHAHNYLPELCSQAWDEGVPRYLIPYCAHADGYYCLSQEGTALDWRHGNVGESEWETIWEWAADIWAHS